jgi:hypothetical protein
MDILKLVIPLNRKKFGDFETIKRFTRKQAFECYSTDFFYSEIWSNQLNKNYILGILQEMG